jgi:16S rRNA (cytosine1402-N4)-methyltransferase
MPQAPLRIAGKALRASAAEIAANPRARSATLRAAERTGAVFDASLLDRIGPEPWRS